MLMKSRTDSGGQTRQPGSPHNLVTVPGAREAANAAHWSRDAMQARRMRRQRRMARAAYRPAAGWSLRTW